MENIYEKNREGAERSEKLDEFFKDIKTKGFTKIISPDNADQFSNVKVENCSSTTADPYVFYTLDYRPELQSIYQPESELTYSTESNSFGLGIGFTDRFFETLPDKEKEFTSTLRENFLNAAVVDLAGGGQNGKLVDFVSENGAIEFHDVSILSPENLKHRRGYFTAYLYAAKKRFGLFHHSRVDCLELLKKIPDNSAVVTSFGFLDHAIFKTDKDFSNYVSQLLPEINRVTEANHFSLLMVTGYPPEEVRQKAEKLFDKVEVIDNVVILHPSQSRQLT